MTNSDTALLPDSQEIHEIINGLASMHGRTLRRALIDCVRKLDEPRLSGPAYEDVKRLLREVVSIAHGVGTGRIPANTITLPDGKPGHSI